MNPMFNDCIIMAGGSGARLWPASTSKRPKQFLPLSPEGAGSAASGGSFFAASLERALRVTGREGRVIIISGNHHVRHITETCAALGAEERRRLVLIPEPAARNTAPAVACGVLYADWVSGGLERNILVLTSDHIIRPPEVFEANAAAAAAYAQQDKLAVFGISPRAPETGYGYIETAEALSLPPEAPLREGRRYYEPEVFRALRFREKPDRKTAETFIAAGNFFWNSGMFAFSSKFILEEYRKNAPNLLTPFRELRAPDERSYRVEGGLRILENWGGLEQAYRKVASISFDYAIAEKCGATVMIKAGFDWTDVGSWDEYLRIAPAAVAEVYRSGADACFVDSDIPVALCGVKDLVVVVRSGRDGGPPAVLVAKKGETQGVREIVDQIRAAGRTELL
jgi:mannose-1-phosphate guanylyltransferase/mannose-1-phosphate guanylyltransferase/mannose-6-phosphate isomerase